MIERCHIEKLRDMLNTLQYDAQFLYQYGSASSSLDIFEALSIDDRKRLIVLALIEGDDDVRNVARFLMGKLPKPSPPSLDQLLLQMCPEDRNEIESIRAQLLGEPLHSYLTTSVRERIVGELQKACDFIGSLEIEEAHWIFIPPEPGEDATWIKAMGGGSYEFFSRFGSPFEVGYQPSQEEIYQLIDAMHMASWVLHVHNHPTHILSFGTFLPSQKDMAFAAHWKSLRPELAEKMMFFVIQSNLAIEYANKQGVLRQWI